MRLIGLSLLLFVAVPTLAQTTWKVDAQKTKVEFWIRNSGIQVDGSFSGASGTIVFDAAKLEASSVKIEIPVATVKTGITARDNHLKKEDYFNATQYPSMSFVSKGFTKSGTNYRVKGIITIKGKSKEIEVNVSFKENQSGALFETEFELNRLDFGVGSSSWVLSDVAKVKLSVQVTK